MTLQKILLVLGLFIIFSNSYAGGSLAGNKITKLAFQTGGLFIYADNWPNPNDCSNRNAIVLKDTDVNYDKAYSLILMAYSSGKTLSGYSDSCASFDGKTYNTIRGFKYLVVQ